MPGFPVHDDDLGRGVPGPPGDRVEIGQFVIASDQPGRAASGRRRRGGHLSAQDGGVEGDGLGRGIRAELGGEPLPGLGVGRQGRRDPAAGDVGAQQDPQRGLVVSVGFHRGRRGVGGRHPVSGLEQDRGGDLPGPPGQPVQLGQPQLSPFARHLRRRVAAQQRQRDPGRRGRAQQVPRGATAVHLFGERSQLGRVEPVTDQHVAAVTALDALPAQHRTQPADQHRHLVLRAGRAASRPTACRPARRPEPAGPHPAPARTAPAGPSCCPGPAAPPRPRRSRSAPAAPATS